MVILLKNEKHHLCNKWYHKPTNDKKISEIHKDTYVLSLIPSIINHFNILHLIHQKTLIKKLIKNDNLVG